MDEENTAIHEAGHAVAQHRLGIDRGIVSIVPDGETLGGADGAGTYLNDSEAEAFVLMFLAGYGALLAAGRDDATARTGADSDFERAQEIIDMLGGGGDLESWLLKAAEMMIKPENKKCVNLIARALLSERELKEDLVGLLIDLGDGEETIDHFLDCLWALEDTDTDKIAERKLHWQALLGALLGGIW